MNTSRDPFALFLDAHEDIRVALATLQRLSAVRPDARPTDQDRADAQGLAGFLERHILPHHREEEREFWPLVARAEGTPEEREAFNRLAQRLQAEHAELEHRWSAVASNLHELAAGRATSIDGTALAEFAQRYREHAMLEDEVLVPLARHLLAPTEQNRLAVSVLLSRLPAGKWGMV